MFCLFCQLTFPVRDISFHSTSSPVLFQLLDHMLYFVSTFLRFYFEPGYIISFYFWGQLLSLSPLSAECASPVGHHVHFLWCGHRSRPSARDRKIKPSTGKSSEVALKFSTTVTWFDQLTPLICSILQKGQLLRAYSRRLETSASLAVPRLRGEK